MDLIAVRIRPIAAEDVAIVQEHIAFDWGAPKKHRERFEEQNRGEVLYLVAWNEELPVGHLVLKWQGTADEPMVSEIKDCPDMEDLFVNPEFRSKGTGSSLLLYAEQCAVERGKTRVGLGRECRQSSRPKPL